MYKHVEMKKLEQEASAGIDTSMSALEACLFLPDYLLDETLNEQGHTATESMEEFQASTLYMEQILRIFPKEFANRLRMSPAYEETLMKYDEAKGEGSKKE